jgi:hypothetical protein
MTSQKQIDANRANAKRSTGPRTAAGKMKSSRNALRHGLFWPLPPEMVVKVRAIAQQLAPRDATAQELKSTFELTEAHVGLARIRALRNSMLQAPLIEEFDAREWKRLAALDRYERYAHTRRRRALVQLEEESSHRAN